MPFQNAPTIVACGAKICMNGAIVVRKISVKEGSEKTGLQDREYTSNYHADMHYSLTNISQKCRFSSFNKICQQYGS
jgi:hypothetical protein